MLSRYRWVLVLAGVLVLLAFPTFASAAPGEEICPPRDPYCEIDDEDERVDPPGEGTEPGGGGGSCSYRGEAVPCNHPDYGVWIGGDGGCWVTMAEGRQDPEQWPPPEGEDPDGAWYVQTCIDLPNGGCTQYCSFTVWLTDAPLGPPDPEVLARRALARILLRGADIRMSPPATGAAVVGVPVWLSTVSTVQTWGPANDQECERGLCVSLTARAEYIDWVMGDGSEPVRCYSPGEPWRPGETGEPDCGHTYVRSSRDQPEGRYAITATTTWRVDWSGGGQSGVLRTTRDSSTSLTVNEIQVLVSR